VASVVQSDHGTSFPVHGGTCTVVDDGGEGQVRIQQSVFRHVHGLVLFLAVLSVVLALVTAFTGWQYVTGTGEVLTWLDLLVLGLVAPVLQAATVGWRRVRGYTGASRLAFERIERVELTTTSIQWYVKTRRTVPTFVVTYRTDGTEKRRRIMLDPRYEDADLQRALDAFRDAGLTVAVDDSARDLLP
jgi:hypothetical protein